MPHGRRSHSRPCAGHQRKAVDAAFGRRLVDSRHFGGRQEQFTQSIGHDPIEVKKRLKNNRFRAMQARSLFVQLPIFNPYALGKPKLVSTEESAISVVFSIFSDRNCHLFTKNRS
jgi:hypothetical protein